MLRILIYRTAVNIELKTLRIGGRFRRKEFAVKGFKSLLNNIGNLGIEKRFFFKNGIVDFGLVADPLLIVFIFILRIDSKRKSS